MENKINSNTIVLDLDKTITKTMKDIIMKLYNEDNFSELYNYLLKHNFIDRHEIMSNIEIKSAITRYCVTRSSSKSKKQNKIYAENVFKSLETNKSIHDLYWVSVGNHLDTPDPINTTFELLKACELLQALNIVSR